MITDDLLTLVSIVDSEANPSSWVHPFEFNTLQAKLDILDEWRMYLGDAEPYELAMWDSNQLDVCRQIAGGL